MGCGSSRSPYVTGPKTAGNVELYKNENSKLDEYEILNQLGSGASCRVVRARNKDTGFNYALKELEATRQLSELWRIEVPILQAIDHPNILSLHDAWRSKDYCYIVTDLLTGGELFDRLVAKDSEGIKGLTDEELSAFMEAKGIPKIGTRVEQEQELWSAMNKAEGPFTDRFASKICKQMVKSLFYIHTKNISHRDLKPENYVFKDFKTDTLCLIDFGTAFMADDETMDNLLCGTPFYMAPEACPINFDPIRGLSQEAWKRADIWSLGICVYVLLTGQIPWGGQTDDEIFANIVRGKWRFPDDIDIPPSDGAQDFVRKCVVLDPKKRITAAEALKHPWIVGHTASDREVSKMVVRKLRKVHKMNRLRKAAGHLLARNMDSKDREHLMELFREHDTDGTGELDPKQVKALMNKLATLEGFASMDKLQANMEVDADGKLNPEELLAARARAQVDFHDPSQLRSVYDKFSPVGGVLTRSRMLAVCDFMSEDQVSELMVEIGNGNQVGFDGFINIIERSVMVNDRMSANFSELDSEHSVQHSVLSRHNSFSQMGEFRGSRLMPYHSYGNSLQPSPLGKRMPSFSAAPSPAPARISSSSAAPSPANIEPAYTMEPLTVLTE